MMGKSLDITEMDGMARPLLPIIFVLDTSGSMIGQPITVLNRTMEEIKNLLGDFAAQNADALVKIGVLDFNSSVKWMQPKGLEELPDFIYTGLNAAGMTALDLALNELNDKLSRKKFLESTTGWCKPVIIFMTDGMPNDDSWIYSLEKLKNENKWFRNSIRIGFAVGDQADVSVVSKVVGNPEAVIKTNDLSTFSILLQKVAIKSAMIGSQSHLSNNAVDPGSIVKGVIEETDTQGTATTGTQEGIKPDPEPAKKPDWDDEDEDWK